jgi:nucleotide-binding universal stress UspA family protein
MPHIKRILFPVDFSDSCVGAARYVEFFAGQFQAELMLLHAVGMGELNTAEELLPARRAQLDAFLTGELKYFGAKRVSVVGDPATAVVQTAASWNPDLVMMPTHGLGFFRRHLIGSVAAKALHDLACPVWTSIHAEDAPALEAIHCRRVLCAVDLTERSRCVLAWAAWLAGEYQADLAIVHATSPIEVLPEALAVTDELQQQLLSRSRAEIGALQTLTGTRAQAFIYPGRPSDVIAAVVNEFSADLLIIGRHTEQGFPGELFQNAYGILRDSPCPVISI